MVGVDGMREMYGYHYLHIHQNYLPLFPYIFDREKSMSGDGAEEFRKNVGLIGYVGTQHVFAILMVKQTVCSLWCVDFTRP